MRWPISTILLTIGLSELNMRRIAEVMKHTSWRIFLTQRLDIVFEYEPSCVIIKIGPTLTEDTVEPPGTHRCESLVSQEDGVERPDLGP